MTLTLLAVSLWFGSWQAMVGTKNATASHPPIEQQAYVTQAECTEAGKALQAEMQAHPPMKIAGAKWVFKCTKKPFKPRSLDEIQKAHDAPNHHHEGM